MIIKIEVVVNGKIRGETDTRPLSSQGHLHASSRTHSAFVEEAVQGHLASDSESSAVVTSVSEFSSIGIRTRPDL